ncbi:unnamed protein product [Dicrocoelium dendriticum]|nr:unnamed protein product [Dicrocoelium dendriticum]
MESPEILDQTQTTHMYPISVAHPTCGHWAGRHVGADSFMQRNPNWDGRDTVIAIWDTGVDPRADGLQVTSDGRPKIVDLIDASGSGDVKMYTKRIVDSRTMELETLTGRKVVIPAHWKPADGCIRLGVKLASELFPRPLLQRLRTEEKDHIWRPCMKNLAAKIASELTEAYSFVLDSPGSHSRASSVERNEEESRGPNNNASGATHHEPPYSAPLGSPSCPVSKRKSCTNQETAGSKSKSKREAKAQMLEESLSSFDRHYLNLDMVYDCFVFFDGSNWQACVDTSPYEPGKTLNDMPLLMDYSIAHQSACFGDDTQLFYTVKIFDDGKVLQIVTNDSGHGTHVAAMAAGYFPPLAQSHVSPRPLIDRGTTRNGIAPGAQIVSIKISDSRLGSMETGISLLRAIRWTVELNCDVVNYSFGEYSVWPNIGRVCKHLSSMVNSYGIVMVASGGNNGPGLGTVGCPGGVVEGLIGVAPLVFHEMMRSLYSHPLGFDDETTVEDSIDPSHPSDPPTLTSSDMQTSERTVLPPTAYTWGSRGPAMDGSLGVCVAAPGAAITSVAGWQLRPCALLNGSSMSSPIVAGSVALLLSGIRSRYSPPGSAPRVPPSLIRLAICNTASPVNHLSLLDQGHGLLQVDKAFDFLSTVITLQKNGIRPDSPAVAASRLDYPIETQLNLSVQFGWRLRCSVSGPGCTKDDRGIWLRRGWIPKARASQSGGPSWRVLRYNLHISLEFDSCVPLEFRRHLELHLSIGVTNQLQVTNEGASAHSGVSCRPAWIQLASSVIVTNQGRDVILLLDPNKFTHEGFCNSLPSISSYSIDRKATSQEGTLNRSTPLSTTAPPIPSGFSSSEPYVTFITFTDPKRPSLGVLAHVPLIIHTPIVLPSTRGSELPRLPITDTFDAFHKVRRWFINVPFGSTAGVLRLARLDENDASCEFKVTVSLPQPRSGLTTHAQEITWPLLALNRRGETGAAPVNCRRGSTRNRLSDDFEGATHLVFPISWEADYMELTIAQHWGPEAPAVVFGELYFRGLEPTPRQILMTTSDFCIRMVLRSNFSTENITPVISLTHWVLPVRPTSSRIFYLGHGQNEILLSQRGCYALRLFYHFSCPFKHSVTQFELPWLHELLYESDYLTQMYHVYDCYGRFLGAGDFDVERSKRPRFALPLDKGDYKVIVQICHEDGANLGPSVTKSGGELIPTASGAMASGRNVGGGSVSGDTQSPLERLRSHCAVVRFRLPSPNSPTQLDSSPRCNEVGSPGNLPVTFEFASFPFSLGLNGAKPCSALDPLPHTLTRLSVTPTKRTAAADVGDLSCDDSVVSESNRRCPCLPNSLGPTESTALFVGLADQRFPGYVVAGSYFSGTFGCYSSSLLQTTITYPFRLLVDSLPAPVAASSLVKASSMTSTLKPLNVGALGLSEEDFAWLRPLRAIILSASSNAAGDRSLDCSKGGQLNITDEVMHLAPSDDRSTAPIEQVVEGVSEIPYVSTPCDPHPPSDSAQGADVSREQLLLDGIESCTGNGSDNPNQAAQNSTRISLSEPGTLHSAVDSVPHVDDNLMKCPEAVLPRRSLILCEDSSPCSKASPHRSLSTLLVSVHELLTSLDAPLSLDESSLNANELIHARSSVWSKADVLIVGHLLDQSSPAPHPSPPSVSHPAKTQTGRNFLHHLLTMRLVSTSQHANCAGKRIVLKQMECEGEAHNPPTVISIPPNSTDLPAPESGLQSSGSNTDQLQLKQSTTPDQTADEHPPSVDADSSSTTFSFIELKLRLIDTLARYGRLLCERILLHEIARSRSIIVCNGNPTNLEPNIQASPTSVFRSPTSGRCGSCTNANDIKSSSSRRTDSLTSLNEFRESRSILRRIYARVVHLLTLTTTGTQSVAETVRVGAHALPHWLLVSGLRDLKTHSINHKVFHESRTLGSVGGRAVLFLFLFSLSAGQDPQALRLLTRLMFQIKEPPVAALNGPLNLSAVTSMSPIRPVIASVAGSIVTARYTHVFLIWLLDRMGWTDLAAYFKRHVPLYFPERDYTLMCDNNG